MLLTSSRRQQWIADVPGSTSREVLKRALEAIATYGVTF